MPPGLALAGSALISLAACGKSDPKPAAKPEVESDPKPASGSASKADPKAFADAFLAALNAKDTAKLDSMMLTDGVTTYTLELFKIVTMRDEPTESANFSVEVVTPTAGELEKFDGAHEMPDGKMHRMPMAPSHIMKITNERKDAAGEVTGSSSSSMPIVEKDGRFVILLPVPAE